MLPGEIYTYMTVEEAISLARQACGVGEELWTYWVYIGDDPANMHWKVSFYEPQMTMGEERKFKLFAQINGKTGEVEYTGDCQDQPWYAPLVLTQSLDDRKKADKVYTVPVC